MYQQHGAALMAYANRLTGGRQAWADDVVTETLVRAAKAGDLGKDIQARLWLFRTVQDVVGEGTDSVVPVAQRRQLAVADALFALPPRHRDVLVAPKPGAAATKDAFAALQRVQERAGGPRRDEIRSRRSACRAAAVTPGSA
ncbi:hypothetical protein KUTG_01766 [Kutzneria sp. 744]|nr:hypothetical protein KUTG_01766 [Kutzneria sp. 744]